MKEVACYLSTVSVLGNVFYFHLPSLFLKCFWRNLGTTLIWFAALHFPVLLIFLDYKDIPSSAVEWLQPWRFQLSADLYRGVAASGQLSCGCLAVSTIFRKNNLKTALPSSPHPLPSPWPDKNYSKWPFYFVRWMSTLEFLCFISWNFHVFS